MATTLAIRTLEQPHSSVRASAFAIPHLPTLESVPRRLSAEDEAELRKFLGEPHVAAIRGSSGFGGQLERAAALGWGPLPCRRCGGKWRTVRRRDGREDVVDWQEGSGLAPRNRFGRRVSYTTALAAYRAQERQRLSIVIGTMPVPPDGATWTAEQAWEGLKSAHEEKGLYLVTEAELRELFPALPEHDPVTGARLCDPCSACNGLGVVPRRAAKRHDQEVTCWPKGSSVMLGDAEPDARLSIWGADEYLGTAIALADVAAVSPLARAALELYYRPRVERQRAVSGRKLGGGGEQATAYQALYELTPAQHEPEGERGDPKEWQSRRAAQADELYDHAGKVWNLTRYGAGSGPGEPDPYDLEFGADEDELPSGTHKIDAATYLALTAEGAA